MKGWIRRAPGEAPGPQEVRDVCASFQQAAVDMLVERLMRAAREIGVGRLVVAGGVACNGALRRALKVKRTPRDSTCSSRPRASAPTMPP